MILADKITQLRKKNNWSQEELANSLGVSRQAVSKWESAQSIPDLDRILAMSDLFGVSTDYLMRDEIEEEDRDLQTDSGSPLARLSIEDANAFLQMKHETARWIGLGAMLCVLAVVPLMLIEVWAGLAANVIGWIVAVAFVAGGVSLFVTSGFKSQPFEWLDRDRFETAYGVDGMTRERMSASQPRFIAQIVVGIVLCGAALAVFGLSDSVSPALGVHENVCLSLGFVLVAIAVYLFVKAAINRGAYSTVLRGGRDSRNDSATGSIGKIAGIYWLVVVAVFLGYSFITNAWNSAWIILLVAAVLFGVIALVMSAREK